MLGALILGACNNSPSPSPSPSPTASPSATTTSSAAPSSQAPSASATAAACTGTDIRATGGPWGGAAGSRGSDILVENQGSAPCLLPASPTIAVIDAGGAVLVSTPARAGSGPSVAPGGKVDFSLVIGNWCAQGTQLPLHFRLALAGDAVDIGNLVMSSTDELPPCNGPGQPPNVSATDWQPE
ncbi:MAG: DUF4232 domain-containing protein [Candidatus Limnocylindrales bacterium]